MRIHSLEQKNKVLEQDKINLDLTLSSETNMFEKLSKKSKEFEDNNRILS